MSGQQERIPSGEWRKAYSICHASVKVTQTEYQTTATTLDCLRIGVQPDSLSIHPYEMDWTSSMGIAHGDGEINKDTPEKIVLHS